MTLDNKKKSHQTRKMRVMRLVIIIIILSETRPTIVICDS